MFFVSYKCAVNSESMLNDAITLKLSMNILLVFCLVVVHQISCQSQVQICPSNCIDCQSSTKTCFACDQNYQLTLKAACYFEIIDHCSLYGLSNQCLKCQPTYSLNGSACFKQYSGCLIYNSDQSCQNCSLGFNSQAGKCIGIINCNNFTDRCIQCKLGFSLQDNVCIDNTGTCQTFDNKLGVCTNCKDGFQLVGYECISANVYPYGCYLYNSSGACIICKNGYILYSIFCYTSSQLKMISNGQPVSARRIFLQVNESLGNETNISSAATQNGIVQNYINKISNSSLKNNSSNTVLIAKCASYDSVNKVCITCQTSYVLVQNSCYYMIIGCSSYIPAISGIKCSQCATNYQLDVTGVCYQKTIESNIANCLISNYNSQPEVCIVCNSGFYLIGGNCYDSLNPVIPSSNSSNNISSSGSKNTSTQSKSSNSSNNQTNSSKTTSNGSQTVSKNTSVPVTDSSNQSGLIQNGSSSVNQTSKNNNSTTNTSSAIINNQPIDPNCLFYYPNQNVYCQTCADKYFANAQTGKCQSVSSLCKTYNSNNGQCLSCFDGYTLTLTNCILINNNSNLIQDLNCKTVLNSTCVQCYTGYFLNNLSICALMNPICKTVNRVGDCTSCYQGYWLVKGNCTTNVNAIKASAYDVNCKTIQNNTCLECYPGYRLNINSCLVVNPLCKTSNNQTGGCISCYQGYYLSQAQCYLNQSNTPNLFDPFCTKLQNLLCLECVQGYYVSQAGSCQAVDTNCKTIQNTHGKCTSCNYGFILANGSCLAQTQNCANIDSIGICVNCVIGYYLKEGQCYPQSTSCLQYDQKTGNCQKCVANYILFNNNCIFPTFGSDQFCSNYVNSYCTACVSGSYLLNYQCRTVSPNCTSFDYQKLKCLKCKDTLIPKGVSCV